VTRPGEPINRERGLGSQEEREFRYLPPELELPQRRSASPAAPVPPKARNSAISTTYKNTITIHVHISDRTLLS
jgi:hypothetical protein